MNPVYQNLRMIISLIWSITILSTEVDNFGAHKIFILLVLNTLCWTNTGLIHNKVSNKKSLLGKFNWFIAKLCAIRILDFLGLPLMKSWRTTNTKFLLVTWCQIRGWQDLTKSPVDPYLQSIYSKNPFYTNIQTLYPLIFNEVLLWGHNFMDEKI